MAARGGGRGPEPQEGHLRDCEDSEEDDARVDEVDQRVTLLGPLTDEQRERLMQIAHRCPVHKTLDAGVRIRTEGTALTESPPGSA